MTLTAPQRALDALTRQRTLDGALRALASDPERATDPSSPLVAALHEGWGNTGWSARPELVAACVREALTVCGGVVECGSGLTTLVLATVLARRRRALHTLEHEPAWAGRVQAALDRAWLRNVTLHVAPLVRRPDHHWYAPHEHLLPSSVDLVVCDGPPGTTPGGRSGLLPELGARLRPGTIVLLDDVHRPDEAALATEWAASTGGRCAHLGTASPFARIELGAGLAAAVG